MVKKLSTSITFVLLTLGASTAFSQVGTGRVSGTVKDTEGQPIEGASIKAVGSTGKEMDATTDDEGKWTILGFRTETYEFTVSADGYKPVGYTNAIKQGRRNAPMDFVLEKVTPAAGGGGAQGVLNEANTLYEQGNYPEALAKYQEILDAQPSLYQVHYSMGGTYREMGELDKALAEWEMVLAEEPMHSGSLIAMGDVLVKQGKLDEGVAYFEKAVDQTTDETVPFNVAEIYVTQGEAAKAIAFYEIAAERKPDWPAPYLKIGYAHLNTGDMEAAAAAFEKVVAMAPDSPEAAQAQGALAYLKK